MISKVFPSSPVKTNYRGISSQYNGKLGTNPLRFVNAGPVTNVTVRCNGKIFPRASGMKVDMTKNHWSDVYNALFEELGAVDPPISAVTVDNEFSIYGVNLPQTPK